MTLQKKIKIHVTSGAKRQRRIRGGSAWDVVDETIKKEKFENVKEATMYDYPIDCEICGKVFTCYMDFVNHMKGAHDWTLKDLEAYNDREAIS
jgi:uncharacterized C2H2 Zn-finger protein